MAEYIVLEMPEEKKQIKILNRLYDIDITDFLILNKIKSLPCMIDNYVPTEEQAVIHLKQFQDIFTGILGEALSFPQDTPLLAYFKSRAVLVQIYNIILAEQDKYLGLEYPIRKNKDEKTDKLLELTKSFAKIYSGTNAGEYDN